jgi:hypothetical protein
LTATLHAFGDSFIVGDLDDWLHLKDPNVKPTHKMQFEQRLEYVKYNVSFVSILAKHYNYNLQNHAYRGCGNYPQLDRLWTKLTDGTIKPGDVVLFGLTSMTRDRVLLRDFDLATSEKNGPLLLDREMLAKDADYQRIIELDFYYIVTMLSKLSEQFSVPIIKFNLFDNALYQATDHIKKICEVADFVGYNMPGNTLIDILNDTWGQETVHPAGHTSIKVDPEHEYLYTYYRHPSIEGHKKIAQWWIDHNILPNLST